MGMRDKVVAMAIGQLELEEKELQENYDGMRKMFPPPAFDDARAELVRTYQLALTVALSIIVGLSAAISVDSSQAGV
jgi:hypothetical protein